jgi:hypothetical protein
MPAPALAQAPDVQGLPAAISANHQTLADAVSGSPEAAQKAVDQDMTREDYNAYHREWYRRNPEKQRRYQQKWDAANRDRILASRRRYYREHKEQQLLKNLAWRKAHPDKVRAYAKKAKEKQHQKEVAGRDGWYVLLHRFANSGKRHMDPSLVQEPRKRGRPLKHRGRAIAPP